MKIPFSGLAGPALNFANAVNDAFDRLASVPLKIVATSADLPNPEANQGRQFIIRDTGQTAHALDGAWLDAMGGPI